MRIGRGAGPEGLNLRVIPFRQRGDWRESAMRSESSVWEVIDLFTTQDGSWDVNPGDRFGIDQWARDAYLYPPDHPLYYDGGGGAQHIHVLVLGTSGERLHQAGLAFTSDGPAWLQPPTDPKHVFGQNTDRGWTNVQMSKTSTSRPPEPGPWWVVKLSEVGASDLVGGIGMPWNWHVSTFIVFKATRWDQIQPAYATLREALLGEAAKHWAIQLNPKASLQMTITATGKPAFVPTTPEFDVAWKGVDYVAQAGEHMVTGAVQIWYCPKSNYSNIKVEVR